MRTLHFQTALLPDGVASKVTVECDTAGIITAVTRDNTDSNAVFLKGCALPGVPNLHSHAHQRAMAGLAERSGPAPDSFWTWRETMYGFLSTMTPDQLYAVATQLYVEMLKAGYTHVAEFHYLHHQPDGQPYADPAEMSLQLLRAADEAGIGITLLPVHYQFGGFGRQALSARQRRFHQTPESFAQLLEAVDKATCHQHVAHTGIALHSLRAVDADAFGELEALTALANERPVHIHVAEQLAEVEDCIAHCGQRPVEHLLDHFPVDQRWCLIHATHLSREEIARVASSGAVVGLCPTTEANLGDGVFNAVDYASAGGTWGIGSDSHISISPVEELRWLEYAQRLVRYTRTELTGGHDQSCGRYLLEQAARAGARACGYTGGALAVGQRADMIVLDTDHPLLCARDGDALIDSWIFAGNQNVIRDVYVAGRKVVEDGRHPDEERIEHTFKHTLHHLRADS